MDQNKISQESLQKAMETLGLKQPEAQTAQVVEEKKSEELTKAEADLVLAQAKVEEIKNGKKKDEPAVQLSAELIKGLEEKISALATVIQSKDGKIEELSKSIETITGFNEKLAEKIGMIARTPMERKSLTGVKTVERFEKGEDNKLGTKTGVRELSLSNKSQRAEIAQELFDAATKNPEKVDGELSKACSNVELGQVTPQMQQRLFKDFNIKVVK